MLTEPARPNILVLMTDQQTAAAMSCAGNPWLRTPAMDRLAARGVRFTTAYCTNPLCVPSRVSFLTGRMPYATGARYNMGDGAVQVPFPTLPRHLGQFGYSSGLAGKWHLVIPKAEDKVHGFNWLEAHGDTCIDPEIPSASAGFFQQCVESERPFLLTAMFTNPHNICEWARGDSLRDAQIGEVPGPDELPPLPANHFPAPDEPRLLREQVQPRSPAAYPTAGWGEQRWREYLWAYYRMVEQVDAQIGRMLEALETAGLTDNTVVVLTSDHGDGAAAHQWNQKQALFEECTRVPLVIAGPGIRQGVEYAQAPVSMNLDLFPTFCEMAGVEAPPGLPGLSLVPGLVGEELAPREAVFCQTEFCTFAGSFGYKGRMARTNAFKYVVYSEGANREQLFDIQADPGEMRNLATDPDPALQEVLLRHRQLVRNGFTEAEAADPFPWC